MRKPIRAPIALAIIATAPGLATAEVEVPEVPASAFARLDSAPETRSRILRDSEEVIRTTRRIDDKTVERSDTSGCSFTFSTEDVYGPNLTWTNCSPGPWGTGRAEDISKKGQLWPLKVGNVVHYKFTTINSEGKKNTFAFRSCEVTGTAMASAAGKEYPSYKTECKEHNGTRTFYYSPSVATTVRAERNHKKNGLSVVEFVEFLP